MSRGTAEITLEEYDELMKLKKNNVSKEEYNILKEKYNILKEKCRELEESYSYSYGSQSINKYFYSKEDINNICERDFKARILYQEKRLKNLFADDTKNRIDKEFISKNSISECSLLELLRLRKKCRKEVNG